MVSPTLIGGDCLAVLRDMDAESVDAVVTDPPYELGFMGRAWDRSGIAFRPETWAEVLRVMKPGAHLVAFGAPKNYHRLAVAIEDAGFELRDSLMFMFGTGFPKSLDVSKAIDKAAGAEREVVGRYARPDGSAPRDNVTATKYSGTAYNGGKAGGDGNDGVLTAPATDAARQWQGWGTALKPAYEPIVLARKPLGAKTVAENVLKYGTGAINVDGCRIGMMTAAEVARSGASTKADGWGMKPRSWKDEGREPQGRFPANLIHDGSEEVMDLFAAFGERGSNGEKNPWVSRADTHNTYGKYADRERCPTSRDKGTAARFFYAAKASKQDRAGSRHPTVKPIALMQYLVRLITPPGGTVLDPFAGSGTTGEAARREGFASILIEREEEYQADIRRRFGLELTAAE